MWSAANGRILLARLQRAVHMGMAFPPGVASLNPGLISVQPFRAAGSHASRRAWKLARSERASRATPGCCESLLTHAESVRGQSRVRQQLPIGLASDAAARLVG